MSKADRPWRKHARIEEVTFWKGEAERMKETGNA